jgi:hypothetical protein
MRIQWNPVQVMDAADQLDKHVKQIIKPLQRARAAAQEARNIPHLPEYVKQRFDSFMFDVERVIGGVERTGYVWQPNGENRSETYVTKGSLENGIAAIRKQVPEDALKEAKARPPLFKTGM